MKMACRLKLGQVLVEFKYNFVWPLSGGETFSGVHSSLLIHIHFGNKSVPKFFERIVTPLLWLRFVLSITFFFCSAGAIDSFSQIEQPSDATFRDRTVELGLKLESSAACWVDLNNDGWSELCAGNIWRNDAGKGFTKLAEGLGDVIAADFDNDGFADLFSWSSLRLFRNDRGEAFVPFALPDLPKTVSLGACWGDFNGDGFVDLYVGGYEDWDAGITYPDLLLFNDNGKAFKLIRADDRFRARGVTACDFDRDGDLDVYVSNYRLQPNLLWVNNGKGEFNDEAAAQNAVATSPGFPGGHSIGAVWGDFDNDGIIDLLAGNFAHRDSRGDQPQSRFLKNMGDGQKIRFDDKGTCGVYYQESYASPSAADYDNDGDLDLFYTTVYETASFGIKNHSVLFCNKAAFEFVDGTASANLAGLPPTYQASWADFDHDGDLDLVTAGRLWENQCQARHWIEIRLEGDGKSINRSAIGAIVTVSLANETLTRQVEAGTGQGNQNDLQLHFGLGSEAKKVDVEVLWPGGKLQKVTDLDVDQIVNIRWQD